MPATKNGPAAANPKNSPEASPFIDTLGAMEALPAAAMNLDNLSSLTHLNAHMMMRMIDINRQYLDFIGRRLDKDIAFSEGLAKDSSPSAMFEHLSAFYQTAFEDYAQEAAELLKNSSDATGEAILEAEIEAARVQDEP